jgi:hypothetical protein
LFTAVGGGLALAVVAGTPTARAAWQELALFLSLQGRPEPASANVLSDHEIEVLDRMSPQIRRSSSSSDRSTTTVARTIRLRRASQAGAERSRSTRA